MLIFTPGAGVKKNNDPRRLMTGPRRHQLSTVLSLNSLLKCWGRPQLRKFSNHHRHQHNWLYTQLSKILMFSTLLTIYSTPFFFSRIQAVSWNVQSTQTKIYIHQEWRLLRNEYMLSNCSFAVRGYASIGYFSIINW